MIRFSRLWALPIAILLPILAAKKLPAQVPPDFLFQGKLTEGGFPVNGTADFLFYMFDAPVGGNRVGPEVARMGQPVFDGLFTVRLNFGAGSLNGSPRWLEVIMRTTSGPDYVLLTPRQAVLPVPYASNLAPGGILEADERNAPLLTLRGKAGTPNATTFLAEQTSSTAGPGTSAVRGNNFAVQNSATFGVLGFHSGPGSGVAGIADNGQGLLGKSDNGTAIRAESTNGNGMITSTTYGTGLIAKSNQGYGILSSSVDNAGILASSIHGRGVHGDSQTNFGVIARSEKSVGVYATGGGRAGVVGITSDPSGNGVEGNNSSSGGAGVFGANTAGPGVWGRGGGNGVGVLGESKRQAVRGVCTGTTGTAGVAGIGYYGILGLNAGGSQSQAIRGDNGGSNTSGYAGYFNGRVNITGQLTKGSGAFKIDHPLDPANRYLYHSFVESPDMKNIYDGIVTTDGAGEAVVKLPEWFQALNKDFRYQLTCIGQFAQAIIGGIL